MMLSQKADFPRIPLQSGLASVLSLVLAVVLLGASPGTVLGSETTAGDWTLQQSFRGADADDPTPVLLTPNTPLQITAGDTVGVAMPHGDDLMS